MSYPVVQIGECRLIHGDALAVLPTLQEHSIDSCLTDPPYGLEFMGATWDSFGRTRAYAPRSENGHANTGIFPMYGRGGTSEERNAFKRKANHAFQEWSYAWAIEVFRVLKPGAFCAAFGGDRTIHRLICALEDAGFEIRGQIAWIHGQGWPKNLDVSKALDKAAGVERAVLGDGPYAARRPHSDYALQGTTFADDTYVRPAGHALTAPVTDLARQYDGFGTALKPAMELIVLARKRLEGSVVENLRRWGTGVLNINACRIKTGDDTTTRHSSSSSYMTGRIGEVQPKQAPYTTGSDKGRWPANVVHDGSEDVLRRFPDAKADGPKDCSGQLNGYMQARSSTRGQAYESYGDFGSAARFFYCSKASPSDRGEWLDPYMKLRNDLTTDEVAYVRQELHKLGVEI